jgi:hypothetical protein
MPLSLSETLERIESLKQQLAVWNKVTNQLARYLGTEAREAVDGIPAPGCVRPEHRANGREVVPQVVIEFIISGIEAEKISPLEVEIKSLENLQVVETSHAISTQTRAPIKVQKNQKRIRVMGQPTRG